MIRRHILLPWLFSAVVMFGLSYAWHGLMLNDLDDLKDQHVPLTKYLIMAGAVYLVLGLVLTIGVHKAIQYEWISLKGPFLFSAFLAGSVLGLMVYLVLVASGMSFTKHGVAHMVADAIWQMFEQGVGGLIVSLGIIYDLHQRFLEQERAN